MAQEREPYRNDTGPDVYPGTSGRQEPEPAPTHEVLDTLSRDLDHEAAAQVPSPGKNTFLQPMVWTMMLLVVLLGGWTFLVESPGLDPEPLNLNSFRATPEIVQVQVATPDVTAQVSNLRWMKLRPAARLQLVESASRIASTAGYGSITLNGTDGTILARWRREQGVELLYPAPESVNVPLP